MELGVTHDQRHAGKSAAGGLEEEGLEDVAEGGYELSSAMSSVESDLRRMQIDRRELQYGPHPVGTGCTAEVYNGSWQGQQVAIKQLNFSKGCSAKLGQEVTILLRETAILAQISHDNLVKFYGLAFDQQPYLLITEFCNGGTCFQLVHQNDEIQLECKQQLKICCDVAHAMDYLHLFRPQIIHRDLKSMNLLLAELVTSTSHVPHVKVCDFGLSRMKDNPIAWNAQKMTKEVGTTNWMAPEVPSGNYNEKIDIYSFAMVLFEMIGQEIPFEEMDPNDVVTFAIQGARPDLEAVPPWMPPDLVELMVQCWSQEPSHRPSFQYISATLDNIVLRLLG